MFVNVWAEACFDERYRCAYMLYGLWCTCLRTQCIFSICRVHLQKNKTKKKYPDIYVFIYFPKSCFCVSKNKFKKIKGISIKQGSSSFHTIK